jgi:REP element-mobilizing transposase RayT
MLTEMPFSTRGSGHCWLQQSEIARIVEDALLHFDGDRYRLIAWTIMPNHVHVLIEPIGGHDLGSIVSSWKRFSARMANRALGRSGPFWQDDYWDTYIRNERHFESTVGYIESNPVKAGLAKEPADWPWGHMRLRNT